MTLSGWVALAGLLIQLLVAAFVYGKLTGKVSEHDRQHSSHDVRFRELGEEQGRQWETMGDHAERISAVEARVQDLSLRAHRG